MTISSTINRVSYTGNGVTTAFSFPYYFLADADLVVVETVIATGVQTTKTLTTDYTVSGAGDANGGTVTAVTAPASTVTWTIYRDPEATQKTDFVDNDPLPASSIENPLDKLTMIAQRSRDLIGRSLRQPDGDSANIDTLPPKVTRASKYLAFDADGDPIASAGTTDSTPISTFGATLVDDADAATARTTLGAAAASDVTALQGRTLTAGNGLTGGGTLAANRTFAVGEGTGISVGADAVSVDPSFLRGYLAGLTLSNNATTPNTKVDVAAGVAVDSTNALLMKLAAGVTVDFGTTGADGLDTSTIGASKTYHIHLISKADGTTACLASLSATAPTMPTGYTKFRRIGSVLTDSSSHIRPFLQFGDAFRLKTPVLDVDEAIGTSRSLFALTVPEGVRVEAEFWGLIQTSSSTSVGVIITCPDETDSSATSGRDWRAFVPSGTTTILGFRDRAWTDTSRQVGFRAEAASTTLDITTTGWVDRRGRDD